MKGSARSNIFITVSLLLFVCSSVNVSAAEVSVEEEWKFGAELYFWGASIGGQSADGSDIDLDLSDILDSVRFAFMGSAGVSKGRWSLAADLIYLNAKDGDTIAPGLNADVELINWVVTPAVGYNLFQTERGRLDIIGGARFLYLKADLRINALGLRADDSGSNWDAVIGARGTVDLTEKWYLFGYLDIGTGQSDLTWQGLGGVGYRFKWFDLVAAYRYLRWNFDDNKAVDNLYLHGPAAGIRFLF